MNGAYTLGGKVTILKSSLFAIDAVAKPTENSGTQFSQRLFDNHITSHGKLLYNSLSCLLEPYSILKRAYHLQICFVIQIRGLEHHFILLTLFQNIKIIICNVYNRNLLQDNPFHIQSICYLLYFSIFACS